jgi:hypothetical protein
MEEAQGPTLTCGALLVMMFDSSSCLSSHTKPATGTACEAQVDDWGGVAGEEVNEGCRGGGGGGGSHCSQASAKKYSPPGMSSCPACPPVMPL